MIQDKLIKIANEYEEAIERLDVKSSSYNFLIKNIAKKFLTELGKISKEDIVSYIRDYNFSSILNEDGTRIETEKAEKSFQALGYCLFFAAQRYGAEFVFKNLLPASTVHTSNSKFNPINWLKWIFNKVVWSEISTNPRLEQNGVFSGAVEKFKTLSAPTQKAIESVDLSKDKDSLAALNSIIKRISGERERLNELKTSAPTNNLPPPPPPSPSVNGNVPPPPPPPPVKDNVPPPPSPPKTDANGSGTGDQSNENSSKKNLLDEIKGGFQLRKHESPEQKAARVNALPVQERLKIMQAEIKELRENEHQIKEKLRKLAQQKGIPGTPTAPYQFIADEEEIVEEGNEEELAKLQVVKTKLQESICGMEALEKEATKKEVGSDMKLRFLFMRQEDSDTEDDEDDEYNNEWKAQETVTVSVPKKDGQDTVIKEDDNVVTKPSGSSSNNSSVTQNQDGVMHPAKDGEKPQIVLPKPTIRQIAKQSQVALVTAGSFKVKHEVKQGSVAALQQQLIGNGFTVPIKIK